jgi:hypothetical protein
MPLISHRPAIGIAHGVIGVSFAPLRSAGPPLTAIGAAVTLRWNS